ncbi:MAG TPA: hypothetical protein VIT44_13790 [Cyclobacteriaceae bacterium]
MKYRPDESTLISYLYGELDAREGEKVQLYLQANPEELVKMKQLMGVQEIMSNIEDKEVIAPPVFMDEAPRARMVWLNGPMKTVVGIAASFLLLLVAAKLLGTEISYSQSQLKISFGGTKTEQPFQQSQTLSPEQVQLMINSSLARNNETIADSFAENQKELDKAIKNSLAINSSKIDGLMKNASQASQEQVRSFVSNLQSENVKTMREYIQLSSSEQSKYMEGLLVDFTKYLNEQRKQDLQLVQSKISTMEQNTDQFKQETEQILATIINSGVAESKKQSSYEE